MGSRGEILRNMNICRFCLETKVSLMNIYDQASTGPSHQVPLSLQLMACVGIEVFPNDGMPPFICQPCRNQAYKSYLFKTNCKEADDALKLFVATGTLVKPVMKKERDIPLPQTSVKKPADDHLSKNPKRVKIETHEDSEVITLNYSNASDNSQIDYEGQDPSVLSDHHNREIIYTMDTEEMQDEDQDQDSSQCSSRVSQVFKVKQVKTDVFPCDQCERSFPLKQLLDLHKANHDRERRFQCGECSKSFFTKYDLLKHMKGHTGRKPYYCVVCHKTFSRESLLHRHEKTHTDVPQYLCQQCDKTFITEEDFDAHVLKHKKDRPFSCTECNKSFVFKQGLERHLVSHSIEKPHKCNYCEASFTSTIKLTRHITSHAGLRPYPCKICHRTFLLSHHLTRHMRSHYAVQCAGAEAAINHYKCDLCSMSFKKKDSLINHTAIHSMVNLKCVICNTSFNDATSVKLHINTHLSGLPYACNKCDYSFENQEQLEEHELKHAEMEYEDQIEKEVAEEAKIHATQDEDEETQNRNQSQSEGNRSRCEVDEEEEEEEEEDEEVTEYTITNDIQNPIVVRRSSRAPKVKEYPDFLKDEVISENEEHDTTGRTQYAEQAQITPVDIPPASLEDQTIKPIIRSEGTKVYTRKAPVTKPKVISAPLTVSQQGSAYTIPISQSMTPITIPVNQSNDPITIDDITLTNQDIENLPPRQYIDMKFGDKTLRVQKLVVSKNEMLAMAREGKIEMRGRTFLLKKSAPAASATSAQSSFEKLANHQSNGSHKQNVFEQTRSVEEENEEEEEEENEENVGGNGDIPFEDISVDLN